MDLSKLPFSTNQQNLSFTINFKLILRHPIPNCSYVPSHGRIKGNVELRVVSVHMDLWVETTINLKKFTCIQNREQLAKAWPLWQSSSFFCSNASDETLFTARTCGTLPERYNLSHNRAMPLISDELSQEDCFRL